jgi:polysaccharide export outer membrane protein
MAPPTGGQWTGSPANSYGAGPADPNTPLGVGDIVTFSIAEDRDPPAKLRVTDSGELDIPYAGRVPALGKTCDTVASEARRVLEARYYYKATVKLGIDQRAMGRSLGKVYVTGVVRTPGSQDLYPGEKMTASAAIIKAGGFTQFSDTGSVKVTRKTKDGRAQTFKIDVGAVLKRGQLEKDMEVQDGDFIFVPQKLVTF